MTLLLIKALILRQLLIQSINYNNYSLMKVLRHYQIITII